MLFPELEERLHYTKHALDEALSGNIIERCKQYLALLAEYRSELYKLPDTLGINLKDGASSTRENVEDIKTAVRAALDDLTKEHNRTKALLLSFTMVSGYGAVATLNWQKYKGHATWELKAGGVGVAGNTQDRMSVQEAVERASLLRREEHIAGIAAHAGTH